MPSPLPHPGCSPHSELVKEQLTAGCRIHAISLFLPKLSLKHVKMIRVDTTDCSESQASNIFNRLHTKTVHKVLLKGLGVRLLQLCTTILTSRANNILICSVASRFNCDLEIR